MLWIVLPLENMYIKLIKEIEFTNILVNSYKYYGKCFSFKKNLNECQVQPMVLLDSGGYQLQKKSLTEVNYELLKSHIIKLIKLISYLNPDKICALDVPPSINMSIDEKKERMKLTLKSTRYMVNNLNDNCLQKFIPIVHAFSLPVFNLYLEQLYQSLQYRPFHLGIGGLASFSHITQTRLNLSFHLCKLIKLFTDKINSLNEIKTLHFFGLGGIPFYGFLQILASKQRSYSIDADYAGYLSRTGNGEIAFPFVGFKKILDKDNKKVLISKSEKKWLENHCKCPIHRENKFNILDGFTGKSKDARYNRLIHNIWVLKYYSNIVDTMIIENERNRLIQILNTSLKGSIYYDILKVVLKYDQ